MIRQRRRNKHKRSRPRTTEKLHEEFGYLYKSFAYGGKDRMHDDLVKLTKEGLIIRHSTRPAKWEVL